MPRPLAKARGSIQAWLMRWAARVFLLLVATLMSAAPAPEPWGQTAVVAASGSVTRTAADLRSGRDTAVALVDRLQRRIVAEDRAGPGYHAIIAMDPRAAASARALDEAAAKGRWLGPLHGVPILLKDNIEAGDGMATTAGSLALADNVTGRQAPLVARLRAAGAVILGTTNLSEWANFRDFHSLGGWSALAGQTRNAIDPDRFPCGSSAGSAVAVAAGFAPAAIGTETDGSITCPASVNGLVGLKPTVGLISRTGVIPLAHSQDTAGPITRTVRDAAILLGVMAGGDPADPATAQADARRSQYAAGLERASLKGARIGVMRFAAGFDPATEAVFDAALDRMRAAGAVLVEIKEGPDLAAIAADERLVLLTEFKADIGAYLRATRPERVKTRNLADLIAFDRAHAAEEMPLFGQTIFEASEATHGLVDPAYRAALSEGRRRAGREGIDRMLSRYRVLALVAPTAGPARLIVSASRESAPAGEAARLAAVAGFPHLTVPMGAVDGLPVGMSFIGPAWSEERLLQLGHAFERAMRGPERAAGRRRRDLS